MLRINPASSRTRTAAIGVGVIVCVGALASCGASDDSSSDSSGGGLTTVNVSGFPAIGLAPAFLAEQNGIMKKYGLKLKFTPITSGPQMSNAVQSGQADIGGAVSPQTVLNADAAGLSLRLFGPCAITAESQDDADLGVYSLKSSGITDGKGLEGQKVAVPTIGGPSDLTIRKGMRADSADDKSVTFVQIPLGQMGTALKQGQVDAIFLAEPLVSIAKAANPDLVRVPLPLTEDVRLTPSACWMTSDRVVKDRKDVVVAFQKAVNEATELINKDPDLARKTAAAYTSTTPQILQQQKLPVWVLKVDDAQLDQQSKDGFAYKYQKKYLPLGAWTLTNPIG